MPLSQWNLEFLNHNAQRSYPLTADATKKDLTGSFTLPDDFLVGLDIPVSTAMDMETGLFFIRQIGLFASGVQLIFAYQTVSGPVDIATALIPDNNFERNSVFALGGVAPFDDIYGKVVIGKISTIKQQPPGLFSFDLAGGRIEPQAIRPMIRSITSLAIADAEGNQSERLYGDIELVAGTNIQLSTVITAEETKIIISSINGEGTIEQCICTGDAAETPCIKTINGISPTQDGNFNLVGDDCIIFNPIVNGIRAEDACCQPCCGCEELEAVTRDLENLKTQRTALELFVNDLATTATVFNNTVLGSRLGDRRCLTCE